MSGTFALKAFGAALDAFEAGSTANSEKKAFERSAAQAKEIGQERLDDYTRYASSLLGSARAARSASGVAMTGSALMVDESTVRQAIRGQRRIQRDTRTEVRELQRQAKKAKKRGGFFRNFVGGLT